MNKTNKIDNNEYTFIQSFVNKIIIDGKTDQSPQFVIVCGPVGTGKSRIRKQKYKNDYVFIDAGEVYLKLTNNESKIVDKVEETVEKVGNLLVSEAIKHLKNIIIEIIMDKKEPIQSVMDNMLKKGYKVQLEYIHNDPVKSFENNLNRGKQNISAYYSQDQSMSWFVNYFRINKK